MVLYTYDSMRPSQPTVYQVTRQLKRERQGLYNCICSILDDAAFVEELRVLYPSVPVLANLRCGLWYTQHHDGTCYYKSTDGHMSNWSFSTTRLNLHVAQLATERGGVMIVDATRNAHKGGYPDALTKTIPMWAVILNRAVARLRGIPTAISTTTETCQPVTVLSAASTDNQATANDSCNQHSKLSGKGAFGNDTAVGSEWDTRLHLPLWISSNEVKQIEARLEDWVSLLLATCPEQMQSLAESLRKPLRPLWISQNTRIWIDQVTQPQDLPFTPLYLVTASVPVHGQRRPNPLARHLQLTAQVQGNSTAASHQEDGSEGDSCQDSDKLAHGFEATAAQQAWTYVYVPGAGDDEESWAAGLTPHIMWKHQQELLEAGPYGVHEMVKQLIQHQSTQQVAAAAPVTPVTVQLPPPDMHTRTVATDDHHLMPEGCRSVAQGDVRHLRNGAYAIAGTKLIVGGWKAGLLPEVWNHAQAVLYAGEQPHPGMTEHAQPATDASATGFKVVAGFGSCPDLQQTLNNAVGMQQSPHSMSDVDIGRTCLNSNGNRTSRKCSQRSTGRSIRVQSGAFTDSQVMPQCHNTNGEAQNGYGACRRQSGSDGGCKCQDDFRLAAAEDLGLPPPLQAPCNTQCTAKCTVVNGSQQESKSDATISTAFGAASTTPAIVSPVKGTLIRNSSSNGMKNSKCDLCSVDSLSAVGIPVVNDTNYDLAHNTRVGQQAVTLLEQATQPLPLSPYHKPDIQAQFSMDRMTSTETDLIFPLARTASSDIQSTPANADSFEFSPESVVDLTPPDYISVPLQICSSERCALRAAMQAAEQEAANAAACSAYQAALHSPRAIHAAKLKQGRSLLTAALSENTSSQEECCNPSPQPCNNSDTVNRSRRPDTPYQSACQQSQQPTCEELQQTTDQLPQQSTCQPTQQNTDQSSQQFAFQQPTDTKYFSKYLWLPVPSGKQGKKTLLEVLQPAMEFVMHHIQAGRTVLIHDDAGVDQCVCLAVAAMLLIQHGSMDPLPIISKATIRKELAQLASSYPQARPTQAFLKQVFQYFSPIDAQRDKQHE